MKRYLTQAEALQKFRAAVKDAGGPTAFAVKHKQQFHYQAVQGALRRGTLPPSMLRALKLKIVYMEEE